MGEIVNEEGQMMFKGVKFSYRSVVFLLIGLISLFTLSRSNEIFGFSGQISDLKEAKAAQGREESLEFVQSQRSISAGNHNTTFIAVDGVDLYLTKNGSWNDQWQIEYAV